MSDRSESWIDIDRSFDAMFEALYRDLGKALPHPFDWMHVLRRPPIWRFRARRAHNLVANTFARHGFILIDALADKFEQTEPQQFDEDADGSMVRRLRQVFQYQTGVPFSARSPAPDGRPAPEHERAGRA